ncbi:centrosomal protein of 152 kDa-like [Pollicipes pollicipes]|uniref:centrosomal protein of 152 kDa-like n=1 Tax=Pollicipes pollicipes TaxID=41117 RepID=UPI001884B606|nr:centrosomal protein of 152 kDa-like [Pollicipes pollicipes]
MIEMGLKAHEADWGGDRPERLDPGKYVANKQKDYILARSSRDQLETLYEARGHEIGRLRAEAERVRSDTAAELRTARHQAALAAADRQGLEVSLQQARSLLVEKEALVSQLKGETDSLRIQLQASEEAKKEQTGRLQASEVTVASLQTQLAELQRSEALARNTQRHQQLVDGLQRRHEQELAERQLQLDQLTAQLTRQTELAASLQSQLTESEQDRHRLAADKGDIINQLTSGLEAAQSRCRQLMQGDAAQLRQQLAAEETRRLQTEQQLATAKEQLANLQRDLDACESVLRLGGTEEPAADAARTSSGGESAPFSLRRELVRSLENTRARREEVTRLRPQLADAQQQLELARRQLEERDAQLAVLKDQVQQLAPAGQPGQPAEKVAELERQLAAEQKQRKLAEEQLKKIRHEGEKLHKTAEELRRHLAEQVEQADRARLQAVEEVRQACLQLHDDMMNKLRSEKVEEYEAELGSVRADLARTQEELHDVKELYVKVCQEKDQLEEKTNEERKASVGERERAVKTALDHHYDLWYADWRVSQQAAVAEAVEAERRRQKVEVGSATTQTCAPAAVVSATQTSPRQPAPPPPTAPHTQHKAVQSDDETSAQHLDKLKKKLKRACLDKRKLESDVQSLQEHIKQSACEHEDRMKKERAEADRKLRELKRRSSGGTDSELVRRLRQELEQTHAQLQKLTQQTSVEKEELVTTYETRLRLALEEDRRLAAAVVTTRRSQLTADQLTAECERLRAETERLKAEHERRLQESEEGYQRGLASYRALIENNVAELTKAEEELRRQAAADTELLRQENARLAADNARLAESYDNALAQRQADRENYEQQVRQLAAELDGGEELRARLTELESRQQQADAEATDLRDKLRASKEKLRAYHGYVKEREQHYDAEFRRLEAEYRVAVGKMKEKVMLAREGATDVNGEELGRLLHGVSGFQRTVSQLRQELTGATTGRGVSPLLPSGDNPLASLERIRRDLNYIFPREVTGRTVYRRRRR